MGRCATVAAALQSIESLEELNGFLDALKDPTLKTMEPTKNEWHQIAMKKIALGKA